MASCVASAPWTGDGSPSARGHHAGIRWRTSPPAAPLAPSSVVVRLHADANHETGEYSILLRSDLQRAGASLGADADLPSNGRGPTALASSKARYRAEHGDVQRLRTRLQDPEWRRRPRSANRDPFRFRSDDSHAPTRSWPARGQSARTSEYFLQLRSQWRHRTRSVA